jgi:hypothetical protein
MPTHDHPDWDARITLQEAAAISSLSYGYLRERAASGDLRTEQVGRRLNVTTRRWLDDYLRARGTRGGGRGPAPKPLPEGYQAPPRRRRRQGGTPRLPPRRPRMMGGGPIMTDEQAVILLKACRPLLQRIDASGLGVTYRPTPEEVALLQDCAAVLQAPEAISELWLEDMQRRAGLRRGALSLLHSILVSQYGRDPRLAGALLARLTWFLEARA